MDNISVYLIQLPLAVKGVVSPTDDGDYTIYINSRYNDVQRREIYDHEMRHILLGHYAQPERHIAHQEAEASNATMLRPQIAEAAIRGLPGGPLFKSRMQPVPPLSQNPHSPPNLQHRLVRQALTGAFY